jgi:hypothetical protein
MHRGNLPEARLRKLYAEEKRSAAHIAKMFGCSEHKINYWLLKHNITKRSLSEAIYAKCNPGGDPFRLMPIRTTEDAKLLGLGLGLFWGEGNKKNKTAVRLGNTDPALIKLFVRFLIRLLGIDRSRLRFGLQVFSDMSPRQSLRFWLGTLKEFGINERQFFKVTVTPARGVGTYRVKTKHGVLTVYFSNVKLKRLLDRMVADVAQW